ncbi:MAG: 5,6-dimethylbenzimidazole synthase [Alphaproteobacteria bacterium]|nr:5,6-dimethylbenzimidazole synthase [Alphaproteobacteria bacterium]MBL6939374.1 5,6-dimethylbenzimidazole synthase [Alphaproteobacteria bacterium]MBL7097145.1 5,6-dimethylbenzimidazole synthase [Alphaproteobacteria bacterium]
MPDCAPPIFSDQFRNDLFALFKWRRDVRRFRRDPLRADTRDELIATANLAPSVGLSEPWRFVVVDDPVRRSAIRDCFEACNADALRAQDESRASLYARLKLAGLDEAPCQLAVFADRGTQKGHGLGRATMPETVEYSAVLAIHTLWLAARARGIGLGWVSILDPQRVAEILEVPADWTFVAYLCLGYPSEESDVPALVREGWETRDAVTLLHR